MFSAPSHVIKCKKYAILDKVKGVRSFLGAVNYYRAYIENCSAIARPLTKLTHKNATFNWDDDCQQAFDHLKDKLIEAPILGYPDVSKPFSLYTDASEYSIGGILTQNTESGEKVICYISHQLTSSRLHYPVIEKECFAIIYCLTKLRQYLLGADVTVYTDHAPLRSLFTAEMKNTRVQRWAILLDEYQVKIKYMRGQLNCRADFLSRLRVKPTSEEIKQSNEIVAIEQGHDRDTRTYKDIIYDKDIDMEQLQADDEHCKRCITQLQNDNEKYTNDYILDNKLLFHFGKENRFETEPFLQLVIPREITNIVLEAYHSELGAGHVGFEKTYQKIRSKYFWPNCYKDVVNFVTKCEVCQRRMLRKKSAELHNVVDKQSEVIPSTSTGKVHTSKYNLRSRPFNRIDHSVKTDNIDSSTDDESNMDIPTVDGESAVSKHRDSDSDNTVIYDSDEFDHVPRGTKRGRAPSSSGDSISDIESDKYVLHQARKMSRLNSSESDNSDDNQDDDLDDITDNIGDQTVNVVSHKSK